MSFFRSWMMKMSHVRLTKLFELRKFEKNLTVDATVRIMDVRKIKPLTQLFELWKFEKFKPLMQLFELWKFEKFKPLMQLFELMKFEKN
jgi:hypothetical protein